MRLTPDTVAALHRDLVFVDTQPNRNQDVWNWAAGVAWWERFDSERATAERVARLRPGRKTFDWPKP